jgi:hypothetical protein
MYKIVTHGSVRKRHRLVAYSQLSADDFRAIAHRLGVTPMKARKVGFVAARQATKSEPVETRWNGKESKNVAQPDDWIVTNLASDQSVLRDADGHTNTYVVRADRFVDLYEPTTAVNNYGTIYRSKGRVEALHLEGGFEIMAPWGEMQRAPNGYLLLNGAEVYGNNAETFEATYEVE